MKKLFTTSLVLLIILTMINVEGITFTGTPPAARTGAPGENNCTQCHSGVVNSGTGSVMLNFPSTSWEPDSTYTIDVTVTDATQSKFGFEATVLDPTNSKIGDFVVTNTLNSQIQTSGGKEYISHKSASTTNTWSFEWKAPSSINASSGDIEFYIAGNASNNNGNTFGDLVYTNSITVPLEPVTWITAQPANSEIGEGESTFFEIEAINETGFQWQEDDGTGFVDIVDGGVFSGATTAKLTLQNVPLVNSNYKYRCVVSGTSEKTSNQAELIVNSKLGIFSNHSEISVEIYPNPVNDVLFVSSKLEKVRYAKITSMNGKIMLERKISGKEEKMDMSDLEVGQYIITFIDEKGDEIGSKRVIKK